MKGKLVHESQHFRGGRWGNFFSWGKRMNPTAPYQSEIDLISYRCAKISKPLETNTLVPIIME